MKLLLVVAYFVPEIGSAAHIYFDLAKAFVRRGHEVHVITSYPRKFNLSNRDAGKEFPMDEIIDGIFVHRCRYNAIRNNVIIRGMEHFMLPYYYFRAYQKLSRKFDACLIYIPPLPLYYFARAIKKFSGVPFVLNYQDFHPQELIDVGILKNSLLIKIMEHIERQSYKNADYITVLSKGGIDYIISRGGNPSKVKYIYNGCMDSDMDTSHIKRDFKKKEGIEDKILITYAGILSPFQGLNNIIDAAKGLKEQEDIIFYIVGDGLIKDHLMQKIKEENISNVRLLPLQPRDEYFNIISSSDISLVSLDERMKAPCIPGKLVNLMSMKKPLIAIVPYDCEVYRFITEVGCGIAISPGDSNGLKNTILHIKDNPAIFRIFGDNGYDFVKQQMIVSKNVLMYEEIFSELKSAINI